MTPEETQALALAQWLDANPGTQPPADVDADVLEAVYAFRPDLAPAPSLTVEEILAGVTAGPLLAPAPQPLADSGQSPAPANDPRPRGWLPWALGGASALAAAAIALVLVMPTVFGASSESLNADVAAMSPADVPQERSEFRSSATPGSEGGNVASPARQTPSAEKKEALADAPDSAFDLNVNEKMAQGVTREQSPPAPLAKVEPTTSAARPQPRQAQETSTPIGGLIAADEDAVADIGGDQDLEELDDYDFAAREPVESVQPADGASTGELGGSTAPTDELEAAAEDLMPARRSDGSVTADSSSKIGGRAAKSKDKRTESQAPAASNDDRFAVTDRARTTDLTTLERQARPTGPVAAETEAVNGLISAGKLADARDSAQRMLDAGGLNDARRADLNWALGKALQSLGKDSQARSAYRRAIELRQ
ncbi:MAG: hypothetical protein AB8H79_17735 [Myxococcota bacterium]